MRNTFDKQLEGLVKQTKALKKKFKILETAQMIARAFLHKKSRAGEMRKIKFRGARSSSVVTRPDKFMPILRDKIAFMDFATRRDPFGPKWTKAQIKSKEKTMF
jgi:hypothetical protein